MIWNDFIVSQSPSNTDSPIITSTISTITQGNQ